MQAWRASSSAHQVTQKRQDAVILILKGGAYPQCSTATNTSQYITAISMPTPHLHQLLPVNSWSSKPLVQTGLNCDQ